MPSTPRVRPALNAVHWAALWNPDPESSPSATQEAGFCRMNPVHGPWGLECRLFTAKLRVLHVTLTVWLKLGGQQEQGVPEMPRSKDNLWGEASQTRAI